MSRVERVLVVVPARDEAELIGACLRSVLVAREVAARARPEVEARVVVVVDASTDATAALAAEAGAEVVEIASACVGVARQAGVEHGLGAGWTRSASGATWIAMTDADSVVPPSWLVDHLAAADAGADAAIGRVEPQADADPRMLAAWHAIHDGRAPGASVHGANLGVDAALLARVGGIAPMPLHEDVDLVERLRRIGATVGALDGPAVRTSARTRSRVEGGFASYLRALQPADAQPGERLSP